MTGTKFLFNGRKKGEKMKKILLVLLIGLTAFLLLGCKAEVEEGLEGAELGEEEIGEAPEAAKLDFYSLEDVKVMSNAQKLDAALKTGKILKSQDELLARGLGWKDCVVEYKKPYGAEDPTYIDVKGWTPKNIFGKDIQMCHHHQGKEEEGESYYADRWYLGYLTWDTVYYFEDYEPRIEKYGYGLCLAIPTKTDEEGLVNYVQCVAMGEQLNPSDPNLQLECSEYSSVGDVQYTLPCAVLI